MLELYKKRDSDERYVRFVLNCQPFEKPDGKITEEVEFNPLKSLDCPLFYDGNLVKLDSLIKL